MKARHEEIGNIKGFVVKLQNGFQQSRAELLESRSAQNEYLQTVKRQVNESERSLSQARSFNCTIEQKTAHISKLLADKRQMDSTTVSLNTQLQCARRDIQLRIEEANDTQNLVVELHTRVCETRSKFVSVKKIISQQMERIDALLLDNKKLIQLCEV